MSNQQAALPAINRLREKVSFQVISRVIEFSAALRAGEQQANQEKLIPLERVGNHLPTWLSKFCELWTYYPRTQRP